LKFFTVLNILFTFKIFDQLAIALKNRVCPEIFHEQLAIALKTELPWNFSMYSNIFYHSGFLSNLRLP